MHSNTQFIFPWALTECRRYYAEHIKIGDVRCGYTGKASFLFFGFVFVWILFLAAYSYPAYYSEVNDTSLKTSLLISFVGWGAIKSILGYASYSHKWNQMTVNHIFINVDSTANRKYLILFLKSGLLCILTLGLYIPFFINDLLAFKVNHTSLGNARLKYDESDTFSLAIIYLKALLLIPLSAGIYIPIFYCNLLNYRASNISLVDNHVGDIKISIKKCL